MKYLIIVLVVIGYTVGVFYVGKSYKGDVGVSYTSDTVFVPQTFTFPKKNVSLTTKPIPKKINVDSIFHAGYQKGVDSLHALFTYIAEPFDTTVSDNDYSLRIDYLPTQRLLHYELEQSPITVPMKIITDSVVVTRIVEQGRAWYEVPAYVTISLLLGYAAGKSL